MKQTFETNYSVAVNWLNNNLILCNNISSVDDSVWDNMMPADTIEEEDDERDDEDEEYEEEYTEVFQWYLTDCSKGDVNWLRENFPGLIFTYSELLDLYILCVDHYGTSWDYVYWVTLNENAKARLGQHKKDII